MNIENLTIVTVIIFLIIVWGMWILWWKFYTQRKLLAQKYSLLFWKDNSIYTKYIAYFTSLILITLGIFTIQYTSKSSSDKSWNWVDIAFVLDVSKSMNSLDYQNDEYYISRLDYTKELLSDYIIAHPENRYWLVIFAWDAVSASPLTTDHSTFLTFLEGIDYTNLSVQWTNLEKAIELGIQRLFVWVQNTDEERSKALILLSDWWDEGDRVDLDYIKKTLQNKPLSTMVIGVGKKSWAKIPDGRDRFWRIRFQKYQWKEVVTKLNSALLKDVAQAINGPYITIDNLNSWKKIEKNLESLEKKALTLHSSGEKKDASRWLAILALLCFLFWLLYSPQPKK